MNQVTSSKTFEMAMLTTFLNNERFNELIKNKNFQDYLLAQKELIAKLLIAGFNLGQGADETYKNVINQPVITPVDLANDLIKTTSMTSTPASVLQSYNTESIMATVTDICSQITGYPKEMLEPNLDLEADLGIDTVKQIEILSILKEKYNHMIEDNFVLSSTPTINDVTKYLLRA